MDTNWHDVARSTLEGAESGAQAFPESIRTLMDAGFDGYAVDFRCATRTYYMPGGQVLTLQTATTEPVAERFDADAIRAAIGEAQALVPGYTYSGFCARVAGAGCAGYAVSLLGKRVLYYGRTGETHTEYFPGTRPLHENDVVGVSRRREGDGEVFAGWPHVPSGTWATGRAGVPSAGHPLEPCP